MDAARDSVDEHIARWSRVLPDLDPDVEGAVTRMYFLVRHLKRHREETLAAHDLHAFEYETLHALAGRGVPHRAGPSELATELRMSPAAVTGRLDALQRRGYLNRLPSATDRRKVVVELTEAGLRVWQEAFGSMGYEEERILGVLTATERRHLADLLRRLLCTVERQ
ncbi:MarR family transcriptional regulator [Micromonospora sp. CPCC 206060]|uniref:MarR family winged helix-turn-helix transcriptional regulator n=1 Tax=Micromonospora sp. CPCC 206060 TaxID=3122406 RepID=UPI002FF30536